MRRAALPLLLLASLAAPQDAGRDTGEGESPVLFVRWRRTVESGRAYAAAWQALEPHYGTLSRRRLLDFDGDARRAHGILEENADASLVIALDGESAEAVRRGLPAVPLVYSGPDAAATVDSRADRGRLSRLLALFAPRARTIAVFGPKEALEGYSVRSCATAEEARGADLAWIPEGAGGAAPALRAALVALKIPLVATSPLVDEDAAALKVRPDPAAVGRRLAAAALVHIRDRVPIARGRVSLLEVSLDLRAARAAGLEPPLAAIASADRIRR